MALVAVAVVRVSAVHSASVDTDDSAKVAAAAAAEAAAHQRERLAVLKAVARQFPWASVVALLAECPALHDPTRTHPLVD